MERYEGLRYNKKNSQKMVKNTVQILSKNRQKSSKFVKRFSQKYHQNISKLV